MLTRVEGMSRSALNEGLTFKGGSFGDYWRLGLPLSILVVIIGSWLITLVWPLR